MARKGEVKAGAIEPGQAFPVVLQEELAARQEWAERGLVYQRVDLLVYPVVRQELVGKEPVLREPVLQEELAVR